MKKKIYKIFVIFVIIINLVIPKVIADVGDFESYDSDSGWESSWDDSDWDYDSSWDDDKSSRWSSWDDDRYNNRNESSFNKDFNKVKPTLIGIFIFFLLIVFIGSLITGRKQRKDDFMYGYNKEENKEVPRTEPEILTKNIYDSEIIAKIKSVDELFNEDEFLSWTRDLFVKLQYAWSDRDWSTMRCFETNELYEQHSRQLERYKQNGQINKIERVSVNWVKFLNFKQTEDKDVIDIVLNSKMIDYIIDEKTEKIIKGDNYTNKVNSYKLTFIRKKGMKTKRGEKKLNITNCPNCGAPTEITSSGKCPYCGSIITTEEHDWVLSNLERYY